MPLNITEQRRKKSRHPYITFHLHTIYFGLATSTTQVADAWDGPSDLKLRPRPRPRPVPLPRPRPTKTPTNIQYDSMHFKGITWNEEHKIPKAHMEIDYKKNGGFFSFFLSFMNAE